MDFHKVDTTTTSSGGAASRRVVMMAERDKAATQKAKYEEDHMPDDTAAEEEVEAEEVIMDRVDIEEKRQRRLSSGGTNGGGRRVGSGGGGISCQADKCTADLTEAKRYHRRHKVCEFHSKAPSVLVSALRQRFCQQCSRFHELLEFDDTKRSCRRRLAGHNERRRKSSSEPNGEPGSSSSLSSRVKGGNPLLRGADHERANRVQMSFPGNPGLKYR